MTRIIIFNDGYHTPTCVSENKDYFYGEDKLIKFLCKPHSQTYVTKTIHFEYLDYDTDEEAIKCYEILESSTCFDRPDFHELFNTMWNYKGDAVYE